MVYKRTGYKKKAYRRPVYRKKPTYNKYSFAKRVKNAIINIAAKNYKDYDVNDVTVTDDGGTTFTYPLTNIAQGNGATERVGDSVMVSSINVRGQIRFNSTAEYNALRFIIFRDNQTVADTTPSITQVLDQANPNGLMNMANVGRFTILYDRTFNVSAVKNPQINFKCYIPLRLKVRYNGTAGTDIQKNGLWMMATSHDDVHGPECDFYARTHYVDMA